MRVYNALVKAAAPRADLILVDSQSSRRDVLRLLRLPRGACGWSTWPPTRRCYLPRPQGPSRRSGARYGVTEPFILYLGGLDKRKNVPALLRALATLPRDVPWQLFVSGRPRRDNPRLFPNLPAIAEQLGIAERVRFGFVTEEDKPAMYQASHAVRLSVNLRGDWP